MYVHVTPDGYTTFRARSCNHHRIIHRSLHTQSLHRQIPRRGFHYTRPIKQHSVELKQQQPRKGNSSLPLTSLHKHTSIPSPRLPCRQLFEHLLNLAAELREFGTDYHTTSPRFCKLSVTKTLRSCWSGGRRCHNMLPITVGTKGCSRLRWSDRSAEYMR